MKSISIDVPEEIAVLLDKDPSLKDIIEDIFIDDARRYLLKLLVADKLAEDSKLTEDDIMTIDKIIKKGLYEDESNNRYK
jgi:hypothetical protein